MIREAVMRTAYSLLGDGQGGEWFINGEYTRAIAEMVRRLLDLTEVDNHGILILIDQEGRP